MGGFGSILKKLADTDVKILHPFTLEVVRGVRLP
jgi:hypothetical protein